MKTVKSTLNKIKLASKKGGLAPKVFIFDPAAKGGLGKLDYFLSKVELFDVSDTFSTQVEELFQIRFPSLKKGTEEFNKGLKKFCEKEIGAGLHETLRVGRWVYFPWKATLVHLLPPDLFFELRTNRNRNVLTYGEQKKYAGFTVGVAGLSVGNSIALMLALTGGSRIIKLSDDDELSLSNMNRVRASVADLGINKAYLAARQILEIDPYARVLPQPRGLTEGNLDSFFSKPRIDAVIDAIDDLSLKVRLRIFAKKYKVPVVMATDCGHGVLLDVERYDLYDEVKPFCGRVKEAVLERLLTGNITGKERLKVVAEIVDLKHVSERKTQSLLEIGKTLFTWPQIGNSIALCGVAASFAVQKIVLGEPLKESALLSLDEAFLLNSAQTEENRNQASQDFHRLIG